MIAPEAGGETLRFVMALLVIEAEVVGVFSRSWLLENIQPTPPTAWRHASESRPSPFRSLSTSCAPEECRGKAHVSNKASTTSEKTTRENNEVPLHNSNDTGRDNMASAIFEDEYLPSNNKTLHDFAMDEAACYSADATCSTGISTNSMRRANEDGETVLENARKVTKLRICGGGRDNGTVAVKEIEARKDNGCTDEPFRVTSTEWYDIPDEAKPETKVFKNPVHAEPIESAIPEVRHLKEDDRLSLKQVGFNTISSSCGPLSECAAAMHSTTSGLAEDLAKAHDAYGVRGGRILSVVQPNERPGSTTAGCNMNYSRNFPAPSHYNTRFLLEHCCANKRPSLLLQLEGGTKVQEALTPHGMFEHFMGNESAIWGADAIDLTAYATCIRGTRMGMWALDSEDGDVVTSLDNIQSDSLTSNYLGFASRASRLNHSC
ncbi:hypothetical protein M405DRAFT_843823 [Rhizopogon salebrosus TDB-379]|nr:hypothetical protein M405DRAFT_843823 [Rhizopogon salebrosus TDB-379]